MFLVIGSSLFYHISQKSISGHSNPVISMLMTYMTALIATGLLLFVFPMEKNSFLVELKTLNWASYVLGIAIVGLEMGFLLVYRSGWAVSVAGVFSNVIVALLLIPIGLYFFKDKIDVSTVSGVVLCLIGLYLINRK